MKKKKKWSIKKNVNFTEDEKKTVKDFFNNARELMLSHDTKNVRFKHKVGNMTLEASCQEDEPETE